MLPSRMAEAAVASAPAQDEATGKPDFSGWHEKDKSDWQWFSNKRKLDRFDFPTEVNAKV